MKSVQYLGLMKKVEMYRVRHLRKGSVAAPGFTGLMSTLNRETIACMCTLSQPGACTRKVVMKG